MLVGQNDGREDRLGSWGWGAWEEGGGNGVGRIQWETDGMGKGGDGKYCARVN